MKRSIIVLIAGIAVLITGIGYCLQKTSFSHPFDYDLHQVLIPGKSKRIMICFHGYGGNYTIAQSIKSFKATDASLVSFNFPDHDTHSRHHNIGAVKLGTVEELIPALYVVKQYVIDQGFESIDLYGFSAGGGAIINLIGILNTKIYDAQLQRINIGSREKELILSAIQKGLVILDSPLKSVEEIIALRGASQEWEVIAENYRKNNLRPIDSLGRLKGLSLNIILNFQKRDEVISNRDDATFIERLKKVNKKGITTVIVGNEGGHNSHHASLWRCCREYRLE